MSDIIHVASSPRCVSYGRLCPFPWSTRLVSLSTLSLHHVSTDSTGPDNECSDEADLLGVAPPLSHTLTPFLSHRDAPSRLSLLSTSPLDTFSSIYMAYSFYHTDKLWVQHSILGLPYLPLLSSLVALLVPFAVCIHYCGVFLLAIYPSFSPIDTFLS